MVANRGEIAARVLQAARESGLSTVAVYSDADRGAPYLQLADETIAIGHSPAVESYLNPHVLIEAAKRTSATAVHPGYGFLSESGAFARACGDAGLIFVGPPASVIDEMSRKDRARQIALQAGLCVLPAAEGGDDEALIGAVSGEIGFPALIKAVAGGGGKAMHAAHDEHELRSALASAHREAESAFGDPRLFVERFVEHGRHVEVQVAADEAGSVVHLFERDCSVQRRHQKVLEEAPAPIIGEGLRERLCSDAVRLARSVGYRNVGTVEFLVADQAAYFLEMNTRLQVEHRLTEAVTGVDLVRLQLDIAQGRPLSFSQADIACVGHAIEVRVYAEDPDAGFLPQAGTASFVRLSEHALVDSAVSEGRAVTTYYDPMLAKIVVAGASRPEARDRLISALDESAIFGLKTNLGFCRRLVASQGFADAAIDVNSLDRGQVGSSPEDFLMALVVGAHVLAGDGQDSPLGANDGWRLGAPAASVALALFAEGAEHFVTIEHASTLLRYRDRAFELEVLECSGESLYCSINKLTGLFHFVRDPNGVTVGYHGSAFRFDLLRPSASSRGSGSGGDLVRAPMPGVVLQIDAARGRSVRAGEVLAVLESMKMEFPLRSPRDGVIAKVSASKGDHVERDCAIVHLQPLEASDGELAPGAGKDRDHGR